MFLNAVPQITGKIFERDRRLAETGADFVFGERLVVDELFKQRVVEFRNSLDHLLAVGLSPLAQIGRNINHVEFRAQSFVAPDHGLHLHQIDDSLELVFGAHWNLNRYRTRLQAIDDGVDGAIEIGANAIHLVDEANTRNVILVGLAPNRFRLRLHAGNGVEHRDRAIEHAQGALHLGREIHVARRVDDIDLHVPPFAGGGGGSNGDAALLFLLHPVHGGGTFMDFSDFVRPTCVIQNPLGGGRLTGIDVRSDADVSHPFERCCSWHKKLSTIG